MRLSDKPVLTETPRAESCAAYSSHSTAAISRP